MIVFLYKWQSLLGSLIGAALPFTFWFITESVKRSREHKENLLYIEKILVSNINNVLDIETTLQKFLEGNFKTLEENVRARIGTGSYSIDSAFFPLFTTSTIDENFLKISSKSGFLDTKLIQIHKMSKDFSFSIEDLRHQFKETLLLNKEMVTGSLNPAEVQTEMYASNLKAFRDAIKRDLLEGNIQTYLKLLVVAHSTISCIQKIGIHKWRFKFSPTFKYFENHKKLGEFKKDAFQRVETYIDPIVKSQLAHFTEGK